MTMRPSHQQDRTYAHQQKPRIFVRRTLSIRHALWRFNIWVSLPVVPPAPQKDLEDADQTVLNGHLWLPGDTNTELLADVLTDMLCPPGDDPGDPSAQED